MDELLGIDAERDSWDVLDQLVFAIEWDIKRDRVDQLEEWETRQLLSSAQQRRHRHLLDVMDRRRPITNRLLAE